MADMEASLLQDLPRGAHLDNRGNHGTLGSPHCLKSYEGIEGETDSPSKAWATFLLK
mgnify:CR=1 FL=1